MRARARSSWPGVSFACQWVDQTSTRVRGSAKKIVPRCSASVGRSWSSVTRQDSRDREARRRGLAVGLNGGFRHHLNPGWQANDPVYWSYSPCRPREIGSDGQAIPPRHCLRRCQPLVLIGFRGEQPIGCGSRLAYLTVGRHPEGRRLKIFQSREMIRRRRARKSGLFCVTRRLQSLAALLPR
jgi:hypothetical protein